MTNFAIPIRPAGSDPRHITDIETDFDYVTGLLDSSVGDRKLIWRSRAFMGPGVTTGNYVITAAGGLSASGVALSQGFEWIYINAADLVQTYTTKSWGLFFKLSVAQGVTPSVNFTLQLCPLTLGGASGSITPTAGTPVINSPVVVTATSSNTVAANDGSGLPMGVPGVGGYVPVITTNGTTAANSASALECELFLTYR